MKSLNRNRVIAVIFALLTVGIFSCEPEQTVTEQELTYLPGVKSTESASSIYLSKIQDLNTLSNGRTNESLNFEEALVVSYEGHEDTELIFIPKNNIENTYLVYTFYEGNISESILTIENRVNEMIVKNEAGIISYQIDENIISDVNVEYYENINGRVECSIAEGAINCLDAIQDQLVEEVGYWGALAFDVACSAFIWCRGAIIVGCGAMIATGQACDQ